MYNVTYLLNATNYGEYVVALNTESGGYLGITFLASIAIIFLITFHKEGIATAAAASGFITTLAAVLMFAIGFLEPMYIIYPMLLFAGGVISRMISG